MLSKIFLFSGALLAIIGGQAVANNMRAPLPTPPPSLHPSHPPQPVDPVHEVNQSLVTNDVHVAVDMRPPTLLQSNSHGGRRRRRRRRRKRL